jgi:hypothetical protein
MIRTVATVVAIWCAASVAFGMVWALASIRRDRHIDAIRNRLADDLAVAEAGRIVRAAYGLDERSWP